MSDQPACTKCPTFLHAEESVRTGLCHGCRSPSPETKVETPAGEWSCSHPLVSRVGPRGPFRCVQCGEMLWMTCPPVTIVRPVFPITDENET